MLTSLRLSSLTVALAAGSARVTGRGAIVLRIYSCLQAYSVWHICKLYAFDVCCIIFTCNLLHWAIKYYQIAAGLNDESVQTRKSFEVR
jgi:hypothetical protein